MLLCTKLSLFFTSAVIRKNNKYISDLPHTCNTFKKLQVLVLCPSTSLQQSGFVQVFQNQHTVTISCHKVFHVRSLIVKPLNSLSYYDACHWLWECTALCIRNKQRCSQSHWQSLSRRLQSMECISSTGSFLVIPQSQPGALQIHWGLRGWIARASAVWTVTPRKNYTAQETALSAAEPWRHHRGGKWQFPEKVIQDTLAYRFKLTANLTILIQIMTSLPPQKKEKKKHFHPCVKMARWPSEFQHFHWIVT